MTIVNILRLTDLESDKIPLDLKADTYFDFLSHPFKHQKLFEQTSSVCEAILGIHKYTEDWLSNIISLKRSSTLIQNDNTFTSPEFILEDGVIFKPADIADDTENNNYTIYLDVGARITGAYISLEKGSIYIGKNTTIEPGAGIKGPAIIGDKTEVRQGAYIRGDCIIGDNCIIRGEIKNSVLMNKANFPHLCYVGDSLCGYMSHFGNQATTANLGIFSGLTDPSKRKSLVIKCAGNTYDLGNSKMGICMGDYSQVGCNSVSDPATFLKPFTVVYPLTRISKGFYGPGEILKNKPIEHGIIERVSLKKDYQL